MSYVRRTFPFPRPKDMFLARRRRGRWGNGLLHLDEQRHEAHYFICSANALFVYTAAAARLETAMKGRCICLSITVYYISLKGERTPLCRPFGLHTLSLLVPRRWQRDDSECVVFNSSFSAAYVTSFMSAGGRALSQNILFQSRAEVRFGQDRAIRSSPRHS